MNTTTETTEQKQQTIAEFIAKHGLTMTALFIGKRFEERKGADGKPSKWDFFQWHCTIRKSTNNKSGFMDQEYRCGLGHIHKATQKPTAPKLADVLDSLASDAGAIGQTFEDWASEFGYDEDSREAERIYHACKECGRKLTALLGRAGVQELQQCERL